MTRTLWIKDDGSLSNREPWDIHTIITGISREMEEDLPRGLRVYNGNKIKVPPRGHKLYYEYMGWCRRNGIGNGFGL